jgi:hypothetical protein
MLNKSRLNRYSYYLKKQKAKNSIAMNLKLIYVDMHVDDFLDMAKHLGYLQDDSDLDESSFINIMHSLGNALKSPEYKIRDPVDFLQEAAFRYELKSDGILKEV